MQISVFLVISLCSVVVLSFNPEGCEKADDCGPGECCVLGMERYSMPQCKKRGKRGEWCRSGAVPEDRTLYYPNEIIKEVQGIYTLFCPCADTLNCKRNKCEMQTNQTSGKWH